MANTPVDFSWLVQFSRLVSAAAAPDEPQRALVEHVVERLPVDGAAVMRVDGDRLVVSAARGLPEPIASWTASADEIGPELGDALLAHVGPPFVASRVLLLVVAGDLYGALVLAARAEFELTPVEIELLDAMVDLAAIAIARTEAYASLARSYTELKASRDALARSERLRILGQMAAGVSHDVKNILNPLGLQLEILRRKLARGETEGANQTIDTMRDVIRHGVDVVDRLRAFSRQAPEAATETVDVAAVVATAVELTRPRLAQHGGIVLEAHTAVTPPVHARASELATAVVNLIVNATEAMLDGGTITVTTGERDGHVWIAVRDTGPGMSPDVQRNVFEPFFTTKREGTGLGLAMVYAFVQRYNGRIELVTAPGEGTTFTLMFPAMGDLRRASGA